MMTATPAVKKFRFDSFAFEFAGSSADSSVVGNVDEKLLDQTADNDNDSGIGETLLGSTKREQIFFFLGGGGSAYPCASPILSPSFFRLFFSYPPPCQPG
jgi:hypothetical protein